MNFQPRRSIRDQRVSDRVGLRESVAGEGLDEVENLGSLRFRITIRCSAGNKFVALLLHHGLVLLAHCLSKEVGVAEGEAGDGAADLHHLLLIDDDAVRFLEDFFECGNEILRLRYAVLAAHVFVDHSRIERAGPIERVERDEVLELRRLRAP